LRKYRKQTVVDEGKKGNASLKKKKLRINVLAGGEHLPAGKYMEPSLARLGAVFNCFKSAPRRNSKKKRATPESCR
jgi:hypothetical protein